MTKRRYYSDAYTSEFNAHIVGRIPLTQYPGCQGIVLNQTYFYPTSGGQPHDTGRLAGYPVVDVWLASDDHTIIHAVAGQPEQNEVRAEVDWERRFDHMQQHTGQHILSRAFLELAQAATIGFHLGSKSTTVDLDVDQLAETQIARIEHLANQVVWQNRRVSSRQVTPDEAKEIDLRKLPPNHSGPVRVVEIEGFDRVACGGTHVSRTGEVGIIKITSLEKRGRESRIHFLCGQRALSDYGVKTQVLAGLTGLFTTGIEELPQAAQNQRDELKTLQRQLKRRRTLLLQYEAKELLAAGSRQGDLTIVTRVYMDRDVGELRELGRALVESGEVVAFLGLAGQRSQLIFCRAADVAIDVNSLLRFALDSLGLRSGGGSSSMAQGGGPAVDPDQMARTLAEAEHRLRALLSAPLSSTGS